MITYKIEYDEQPMNPWEDSDCCAPLYIHGGRNYYKEYGQCDIMNPLDNMSPGFIRRHSKRLQSILDCKYDEIEESYHNLNGIDKIKIACELWQLQGVQAYYDYSSGVCQSDWCYYLLVAHPEWLKKIGLDKSYDLTGQAELFKAYHNQECYGFEIYDNEQVIDSCWGFIGDKKYCESEAESVVKYWQAEHRTRAQEKRVKIRELLKERRRLKNIDSPLFCEVLTDKIRDLLTQYKDLTC
jgi:hypothetical protein